MVSVAAVAGSYQSQTDVNYGWADIEGADLSSWNLKQRFYLAPVQTEGAVPLAEAAFMQRQASLHGTFSRDSVEYGAFEANNNRFYCSGHGSTFSTTGTVLNGPAGAPLKQYKTALSGNNLRVFS